MEPREVELELDMGQEHMTVEGNARRRLQWGRARVRHPQSIGQAKPQMVTSGQFSQMVATHGHVKPSDIGRALKRSKSLGMP
eukprot:10545420-Ditylum_brightwellii.AAC.1